MKAVRIDSFGGPEVLQLCEIPDPLAGPNEIVVNVHAASLNPGDIKVRKGLRPEFVKGVFPHTMGRDFSGVVCSVGPGVDEFERGDDVFGVLELGREGAYAEAIAISSVLVARKPAGLSHVEAAAVALTGLTALYALEDSAALKAGETVLIHGGAGGIGGFAIQYARHVGARVYTTASARNHDYVRSLGAEKAIDYATEDFVKIVPKCDVVLDIIGGEVRRRSLTVLHPGGRLVTVAPSTKGAEEVRDDVIVLRPLVSRDRGHLERVAQLVASGAVRPPEIKRLPLSQARTAHDLMERRRIRGKIVFEVR